MKLWSSLLANSRRYFQCSVLYVLTNSVSSQISNLQNWVC